LGLNHYAAARADLESYLKLEPEADDRHEILQQITAIHQRLARLN